MAAILWTALAANLIGKPGKLDVAGHMVQDLWDAGRAADIHDYCRGDVLDTYFLFLRSRVCAGELSLDDEHGLIEETRTWIGTKADACPGLKRYLAAWGDWTSPYG